jgi:hypothetical protein
VSYKLEFEISDIKLIEEVSDAQNAVAEVKVCHTGMNKHNKPISIETLKQATSTLVNKWLVAGWSGYDFKGHEGKNQRIIGFFPKENDFRYVEENGKVYLVAKAIISKMYAEWAFDIFKEENFRECSMEIMVLDTEIKEDGFEWIKTFVFSAVTVLGTAHKAACPGSRVEIIKFSEEQLIEIRDKIIGQYETLDFTIPQVVKDNAVKGLGLHKEQRRGGTSVGLSSARYLINNETITPDKARYIAKHFSQKNQSDVSWLLLGGEDGKKWVSQLVYAMNKKDNMTGGEMMEENKEQNVEEQKMEENMADNAYTEAVAQAELNAIESKNNEELADENLNKDEEAGEDAANETTEDKTTEAETVNYQALYEEMCGKFAELETQMAVYMQENEELKQYKYNIEEKEKTATVVYILQQVMEAGMPKDVADTYREKADNFSYETINIWANEVKAEALTFATQKTKNTGTKLAQAFPDGSPEPKKKSGLLW